MFLVYVVFCFRVFGCQYQCPQLPGKTCFRNDVLHVEWNIKPYPLARVQLGIMVLGTRGQGSMPHLPVPPLPGGSGGSPPEKF